MSYAVVKMGYRVHDFVDLPSKEKAFVMGSILQHLDEKKKQNDEAARKMKSAKKR